MFKVKTRPEARNGVRRQGIMVAERSRDDESVESRTRERARAPSSLGRILTFAQQFWSVQGLKAGPGSTCTCVVCVSCSPPPRRQVRAPEEGEGRETCPIGSSTCRVAMPPQCCFWARSPRGATSSAQGWANRVPISDSLASILLYTPFQLSCPRAGLVLLLAFPPFSWAPADGIPAMVTIQCAPGPAGRKGSKWPGKAGPPAVVLQVGNHFGQGK
jgi:hypothetical protein